ncbi:hypothetical protein HMPREF1316_0290 [Olsenella profusa F0195]|uniref:Uncharacterized protein n=1 Tax=Olsenella profusa F0195 TaxID=1125712 RepID=U2TRR4_9ACTN|nr:hypothetical protein HMPREF1316_0290 [Olsenella profusa F0195]
MRPSLSAGTKRTVACFACDHPARGQGRNSAGLSRRPLRRRLLAREALWGRGSGVIFARTRLRSLSLPALCEACSPRYSPLPRFELAS